jgi:uncharacterized protein
VKSAPVLRGGPVARAVWLVSGLFLCAIGILCFLEARLGLGPWDVLHQGVARLVIAWSLGARIWIGTISNAILIGLFIILLQPLHVVQSAAGWPLGARVGLLLFGLLCFGVGTAFYIGANLGAGPRDSLMLVGSRRTGIRIGATRAMLEIFVLLVGFLLGGKVGLGTLAFAALIGPSVEASFWFVHRIHLT